MWTTLEEKASEKPFTRKHLNVVNNGMCNSSPASKMNSTLYHPNQQPCSFLVFSTLEVAQQMLYLCSGCG
jgi:hypothetical protein